MNFASYEGSTGSLLIQHLFIDCCKLAADCGSLGASSMLVTITDSAFLNTCSVSSDVDLFR